MNLQEIDKELTADLRKEFASIKVPLSDDLAVEKIKQKVNEIPSLSNEMKAGLVKIIFARTRKELSILDEYIKDDEICEIMVIGPDEVFIEKNGDIIKTEKYFGNEEELNEVVRRIAGNVRREINEMNPILDARLKDGSRVNAVYSNISIKGTSLTIRKFPKKSITMMELIRYGSISSDAADFLKDLVAKKFNIFISGGTSSGKTTFLNALSNYIPSKERVITIEDSAELQIKTIPNLISLEVRQANNKDIKITMKDLIKTSLRMRPDRIIVGEVRGDEVIDMVQAMNTGHDGSLSTGHANSAEAMLYRLEAMFLQGIDFPVEAIRSQLSEGIDIIVHLNRLSNGKRIVREIIEITGVRDGKITTQKLFKRDENGVLARTKNEIKNEKY